jgi:glycosyltransferase involved in cell wall biosynthesis
MKIAVVEFAGKGGLIHYAFQLCRAMRSLGADVTLVTSEPYELRDLPHNFEVLPALRLWDPKAAPTASGLVRGVRRAERAARYYREWLHLEQLIRKLSPDVVQMGDIRFATDAVPLRRIRSVASVFSDICHNVKPFSGGQNSSGTFRSSSIGAMFYRRLYDLFDTIFVHYDINVAEFVATFPRSAGKVVPIVHGNEALFQELADPAATVETLRSELGLAAQKRVVLFFGTLSAYKGLDILLDAFENVVRRVPEAVLVVAGYPLGGFSVREFGAESQRRGLSDRLRIVDRYVDAGDVAAWMSLADVVVFPYRQVFQSGALHVAQTFGRPIVASRVGAMPEVIADRQSGLLVEPENVAALAGALVELLRDRELAASLGERAADDARRRFSWDSVAEVVLGTYERLQSRRSA